VDATIDTIDSAAFTTLQALARDAGHASRPFALVARTVQEPAFNGAGFTYDGIVLGQYPACLWRVAGEAADDDVRTVDGDAETRGRLRFEAWVLLRDTRSDQLRAKGGTSTTGLYSLVDQVIGALNNAPVEAEDPHSGAVANALLRVHRLRYLGFAPRFSDASLSAWRLEFEAQRSVPTVAPVLTTVDLGHLLGDVNLTGAAQATPSDADEMNPLDRLDADL
jgi:hypothetical protein